MTVLSSTDITVQCDICSVMVDTVTGTVIRISVDDSADNSSLRVFHWIPVVGTVSSCPCFSWFNVTDGAGIPDVDTAVEDGLIRNDLISLVNSDGGSLCMSWCWRSEDGCRHNNRSNELFHDLLL